MMDITLPRALPIGVITPAATIERTGESSAQGLAGSFATVLADAMQDVNQQQLAADVSANRMAAGEQVDLHQVMIGLEEANLSFSLGLQVRNKMMEAYQEVMRMNV